MRKIDFEKERSFENKKVKDHGMVRGAQNKYYWATNEGISEFDLKVKQLSHGKSILEVGCSAGLMAAIYASSASSYVGVDISDDAIALASSKNLMNCRFEECDAHNLPFSNGSFDLVVVNSLLHHLDLEIALREINRVLKVGGHLLLREPLGVNPLFQLYRYVTPGARTPDEKPFDLKDLKLVKHIFAVNRAEFFGFSVLLTAFLRSSHLRQILAKVDKILAMTPLKYLFWQVEMTVSKR